jgi:arabinofuranosyltransferase
MRQIPYGYEATLETGENRFEDQRIAEYYDRLAIITRGDLFDMRRFIVIIKMNMGRYDSLPRLKIIAPSAETTGTVSPTVTVNNGIATSQ